MIFLCIQEACRRGLFHIYLHYLFVFSWFGVKLVFYVQLKNKMGFPQFYNIFVICALIIFGLASIMLGIEYFIKGFSDGAFMHRLLFVCFKSTNCTGSKCHLEK